MVADNPAPQVDVAALSATVAVFLEQVPVGEGIGVKLSNALLDFLQTEVLPEARRRSDQHVDPTLLFALVTEVLRQYAGAIEPPQGYRSLGDGARPMWSPVVRPDLPRPAVRLAILLAILSL
jgi:hypothetical protein